MNKAAAKSDWAGTSKSSPLKDSESNNIWDGRTVASDDYEDGCMVLDRSKRLPKRKR